MSDNRLTKGDSQSLRNALIRPMDTYIRMYKTELQAHPHAQSFIDELIPKPILAARSDMSEDLFNRSVTQHCRVFVSVYIVGELYQLMLSDWQDGLGGIPYDSSSNKFTIDLGMRPEFQWVSDWVTELAGLIRTNTEYSAMVDQVTKILKTPGQIARAWPELIPVLPVTFRNTIKASVRKSRMPDNWQYNDDDPAHRAVMRQHAQTFTTYSLTEGSCNELLGKRSNKSSTIVGY